MSFHPREDIERLYVSRKEGGREVDSVEDCVDTLIRQLKDYFKKAKKY